MDEEDVGAEQLAITDNNDQFVNVDVQMNATEHDYQDELVAGPPIDPSKLEGKMGFESWRGKDPIVRAQSHTGVLSFTGLKVTCPPVRASISDTLVNPFAQCARQCLSVSSESSEGFVALESVSGYMCPGKSVLVLGGAGSGKSTLLRALSGRLHPTDILEGEVHMNGKSVDIRSNTHRRLVSYVASDDSAHLSILTVRETFWFAASCSGCTDVSKAVQAMLEALGLEHVADSCIGGQNIRGISGGQRRRVSFGEMMFAMESPFLFLDDITNGLDTGSAAQIMGIVNSACRSLKFSAMVALLQPQPELYELFDDILVLSNTGETAYFGPGGEHCRSYFENRVAFGVMPTLLTVPEFILLSCAHFDEEDASLGSVFTKSHEGKAFKTTIVDLHTKQQDNKNENHQLSKYAIPRSKQFTLIWKRQNKILFRNGGTYSRIIAILVFGIIVGTLFVDVPESLVGSLTMSGFLFLVIFLMFFLSSAVTIPDNFRSRDIFIKQRMAEFFSTPLYYLAVLVSYLPIIVFESRLLSVIVYWWVGLRLGASPFFYFFGTIVGLEFVGAAWGRFISNLVPTELMANALTTIYIFCCAILAGYMPQYSSVGWWWRWINWITPVSYAFEGLAQNEFAFSNISVIGNISTDNGQSFNAIQVPGSTFLTLLGQPRIPFDQVSNGLNTPEKLMGFDLGMLFILALVLEIAGGFALDLSRYRYAPTTRLRRRIVKEKPLVESSLFKRALSDQTLPLGPLFPDSKKMEKEEEEHLLLSINASSRPGTNATSPSASPEMSSRPKRTGSKAFLVSPPKEEISLAIFDISYSIQTGNEKKNNSSSSRLDPIDKEPTLHERFISWCLFLCKRTKDPSLSSAQETSTKASLLLAKEGLNRRSLRSTNTYGQYVELSFDAKLTEMLLGQKFRRMKDSPDFEGMYYDEDSKAQASQQPLLVRRPRAPSRRGRAWTNKRPIGAAAGGGGGGADISHPTNDDGSNNDNEVKILNGITAVFRKSHLTALMGESGAGKTTLMDVIAGYKTSGNIQGDVYVNGTLKDEATFRKVCGYAEQSDIHNPYLSIYESLVFSARCRLPAKTSEEEIASTVEHVIDLMDIRSYRNVCVGNAATLDGVPSHVRKRLTIAVELVAGSKLLLLDEPTTGLDAYSSDLIMGAIRRATSKLGLTVVATIHQPSRSLFAKFDDLLLLRRGGQVVYQGPIKYVVEYFTGLGAVPMADGGNAADHVLRAISSLEAAGIDTAEMYESSPESRANWALVEVVMQEAKQKEASLKSDAEAGSPLGDDGDDENQPRLPRPSLFRQISILTKRQMRTLLRNPSFTLTKILWAILGGVLIGTVFLQLGDTLFDVVYRFAAFFFATFVCVLPTQMSIIPLMDDRAILYRETTSGTYSAWAYAIAQPICELPFNIISSVCFYAVFYYSVGLRVDTAEAQGYFVLMNFFCFWMLPSFGQLTTLLSPNADVATASIGFFIITSVFLMGFLIPASAIPQGWVWATYIDPLRYVLQGYSVNEMQGQTYQLNVSFLIPSNIDLGRTGAILFAPEPTPTNNAPYGALPLLYHYSKQEEQGMNSLASASKGFRDSGPVADLLVCLIQNDCIQFQNGLINRLTLFLCIQPGTGILRPGPCSSLLDPALVELGPIVVECNQTHLPDRDEVLLCVLFNILPPSLQALVAFIYKYWGFLANFFADFPVLNIPGNLVLYYFGWAEFDNSTTPASLVANTQWFYCILAVAIYIIVFEISKMLAARYVIWIKR